MKQNSFYGVPVLNRRSKGIILFSFALLFFFNNGDTILLSTAAPTILKKIGGIELYAMIFSVKMLTNAVCMLLCGKLSDKFGRRNILLLGILCVLTGYLGSGFSKNIMALIIFRGITGAGSGFSLGLAYTIMGDLFQGKSHASAYMVQVTAAGIAMVGGPILGGILSARLPWPWVFWILVPLAAAAFVLILINCPNYRFDTKDTKTDTKGMIYYTISMTLLLMLLSAAGTFWKWKDIKSVILIFLCAVFLVLFVLNEHRTPEESAILPVTLLSNRVVIGSVIGQLCMTLNSLCLLTYIPYYMQGAMGTSSVTSGYTLAIVYAASTIGGLVILRRMGIKQNFRFWGRFTVFGESGALILLLIFLKPDMSPLILDCIMLLYGILAAIEGSAFIMTVQKCLGPRRMGAGTSIITFVQAFASVLGTAVGGTIINSNADFIIGIYRVFLFACVITIIGCILYLVFMPSDQEIFRIHEQEMEKENNSINL
jgi:MFS family permease